MTKHCHTCKEMKEEELFPRNRSQRDGRGYECKKCSAERMRDHRARHQEEMRARDRARYTGERRRLKGDKNLRTLLGIPLGTYDRMFIEQDGRCAICDTTEAGGRWNTRFHMDHCWKTKKIRGLLCSDCNRGIGQLKHDIKRLRRAADYLARYECV